MGGMDFPCFLRLLREFHDMNEQEHLNKEHGQILNSLFSSTEVKAFREIFIYVDDNSNDSLSFEQVKEMVSRVIPLGDKLTGRLKTMWSRKASEDSDTDRIDFPEFLMLMKRLLDVNFGGIKGYSALHAAK